MQQDQPIEQRVFILEQEMAELKVKVAEQDDVDIALLRRIDAFIGDLRRIERDQRTGFQEQKAETNAMKVEITGLKKAQEETTSALKQISEILHDHKAAIDILVAGQQQTKEAIDLLVAAQQRTSDTLHEHKEILRDHKEAIDMLAAGQRQIIEMLMGQRRRND